VRPTSANWDFASRGTQGSIKEAEDEAAEVAEDAVKTTLKVV
jgi:hypothetical protein